VTLARYLRLLVLGLFLQWPVIALAGDARALNVSIAVFDPGVPADRALHRDLRVFPRIRAIEARFLPFVLRDTLVGSGEWGAVRVVSEPDDAAEVAISGTIVHSDGERLELRVRAADATGRLWFEHDFAASLAEQDTGHGGTAAAASFQSLYDEVAHALLEAREQFDDREFVRITETSLLRYAAELAPSAFGQYLEADAQGRYVLRRLPARDDPMLDRIERIRLTEYVITDSIDAKFRELHEEIASTYALWREYRRKSVEYENQNARRAQETRADEPPGSYEAIKNLYDNYKWDRVTAQEQDRLAVAFDNEVGPVVEAMEQRIDELEGWVDEKYAEWHRLLEELFEVETELNRPLSSARREVSGRFAVREPLLQPGGPTSIVGAGLGPRCHPASIAVREPLLLDIDELDVEAECLAR
jgi:hypothetical protein